MKKLLLIITVLSFNVSFSQTYLPMLQEGNEWSVDFYEWDGSSIRTDQLYIGEEVILENIVYKTISSYEGVCHAREENGIVYQYNWAGSEEIIYDFTLELGDFHTFPIVSCLYGIQSGNDGLPFEVTNVETLFIAGENRKVIELKDDPVSPYYAEYWIEGIGSTKGFDPHSEYIDAGVTALVCFTYNANGETYFFNNATSCDNTTLGLDSFSSEEIILYPNPVTNISILQLPAEASIDLIKIYDFSGKLIKEERIENDYYTINALDYASGIYFFQLFEVGKKMKTYQFLVN